MDDPPSTDSSPASPHVVGVSVCDSAPLLWRVEDLRSVRGQGLVGALLGSLPRTPRQNGRLGRPLLLLPEEERLLGERHAAATLPDGRQDGGAELQVQVEQQGVEQQRSFEEQSVLALEDRKSSLLRAMTSSHTGPGSESTDEALQDRLEDRLEARLQDRLEARLQDRLEARLEDRLEARLEDRLEARLEARLQDRLEARLEDRLEARLEDRLEARLQDRLEALDRSFTFPRSALAVQLSTARAGLSYCPESRACLQADWPIREQHSPRGDVRFQVFRDLRGRGFYLTSAGKFGGDFLVYPGDPLRFHAHFIAVCLSLDEPVCLLDFLSVARLGSNVKKTVLVCSPGTDGEVLYTSLQWSGMV